MGQELIELIQDTIAPGTWRDAQGTVGSIRVYRGVLIVTHTPDVQRQVAKLLKDLREDLAIQIAIEASFLSISNNFLEQIGLDLDVILNAGNAGYDYATSGGQRMIDPASGGLVLIPRQNSRLGMIPTPAGGGTAMTQTVPAQPWQAAGLVPQTGSWAPHSGRWTPVGVTQGTLAAVAPQATQVPGSLGGGAIADAMTITGTFLDNIQVDFLIRATQADRRSSFLQAPRIVVPQGRGGSISIQEMQNYVYSLDAVAAGGAVGGAGAVAYIPQVSQVSQGRGLDVNATVSPDRRFVTMTLMPWTQEILAIRTFGVQQGGAEAGVLGIGNIQEPDVRMTTVSTTATVPDEGTLLVGGLKLGGEVEIEAGVPVLNKIPVLKRAFSNRSLVKDEATLLILVKPRVVIQKEAEDNAFPGFAEGSHQQ
jgi:type II secretory pathway component GspD/PulD (secretin)